MRTEKKIVTVTANTSIDKLLIDRDEDGRDGAPRHPPHLFPAGKGINVARTAAVLGQKVLALGFVGKEDQRDFQALESLFLQLDLIPVDGDTRLNTTIYDARTGVTTHERSCGFSVQPREIDDLKQRLYASVEPGDVVVLSGSLPPGAPKELYQCLVSDCRARGASVILDSSGEEFRLGVESAPHMVKPNLAELEQLISDDPLDSEARVTSAARSLVDQGVELVVVSLGEKGVIVVAEGSSHAWKANVTVDRPILPAGELGSGDAMVAGFAVGILTRRDLSGTVRLGIACGAANLFEMGPGICHLEDIRRLLRRVYFHEL